MRFVQKLVSFSVLVDILKVVFVFVNAGKETDSFKISWNVSISS